MIRCGVLVLSVFFFAEAQEENAAVTNYFCNRAKFTAETVEGVLPEYDAELDSLLDQLRVTYPIGTFVDDCAGTIPDSYRGNLTAAVDRYLAEVRKIDRELQSYAKVCTSLRVSLCTAEKEKLFESLDAVITQSEAASKGTLEEVNQFMLACILANTNL